MKSIRGAIGALLALASNWGLAACSSTTSGPAAGADGASTADGPPGGSVDAGRTEDAPGDGSASAPDGSSLTPPIDGGASIDGSMAFGVHYSVVVPQSLQAACGYAPGPSTGYGDLVVMMTDIDISSACATGFAPPPATASGHPLLRLEVTSPGYGREGGGLSPDAGPVTALAPGSSVIGFENLTDDDPCMLSLTGGTALLDLMEFGDAGFTTLVGTSVSGTITLRTVTTGHVAGDFNVYLAPVRGGRIDVDASAPFGGQFDTATCPGTTQ